MQKLRQKSNTEKHETKTLPCIKALCIKLKTVHLQIMCIFSKTSSIFFNLHSRKSGFSIFYLHRFLNFFNVYFFLYVSKSVVHLQQSIIITSSNTPEYGVILAKTDGKSLKCASSVHPLVSIKESM